VLAVDDFFEAFDRVFQLHILAFTAGKLGSDVERLREELLDLARARNTQLVFIRQFVETENRDDVLQIFVALQNLLNRHRRVVVVLADNARVKNAR